jgi:hypothetical protein
MRGSFALTRLVLALSLTISLRAADPDQDFSGKWVLDRMASRIRVFHPDEIPANR